MVKEQQSKKSKNARASQEFLAVDTIRDGVLILRDGGYRIILMASAFNFALKAPEEQDAIISQYQNFLNAIDFPLQIMIQSRKLNIEPYLATIRELEKAEGKRILDSLVTQTLITQEAKKRNVSATDGEIRDEIAKIEKNISDQGQKLDDLLAIQNLTRKQLEAQKS